MNLIRPIFIFGCCNSGTTLLWNVLRNHKALGGPSIEGQDLEGLPDSMRHYLGKPTFRLWAHPRFNLTYYRTEEDYNEEDKQKVSEVYKIYIEFNKRFVTKSPADTLRARLIQSYFPDAHFIGIVRNGYAVSEGIIRKRKYDPERPQFRGLHTTIEEAAEQWFRSNVIVNSHRDFLKNYKIIRYEDLVISPNQTMRSILDFCELDSSNFNEHSFEQDLNEKQIARLSEYELESVSRIAKPMLLHYRYDILGGGFRW